jgi:pre-mRNA-splicing factor 18
MTYELENLKDERRKDAEKIVEQLRRRLEGGGGFPEMVLEGLAKAVNLAEDRKYKSAHEEYLAVAVGKAAWPVGMKGLQVKVRGCNDLIQPVHHVLDKEEDRVVLTTFKRLLSAAQTVKPSEDLAENIKL